MGKLPGFMFYPGDWMKDPPLQLCSHAAKGFWMDTLCLMFECEERGRLVTNGVTWTGQMWARMIKGDIPGNLLLIEELISFGVVKIDEKGCFYSKRLIKDELERIDSRDRKRKSRASHNDVTQDGNVTVNESENEKEVAVEVGSKSSVGEELIYAAYPRKVGKGSASRAISKAIGRLTTSEGPAGMGRGDAAEYLLARVKIFAGSPAGNAGEFTPHPATWFNSSRYLDEESEWQKSGQGNNQPSKAKQHITDTRAVLSDALRRRVSPHVGPDGERDGLQGNYGPGN